MKIFIAGSREISVLDDYTQAKLDSICSKGYDVLIGDCYGVYALVQSYLSSRKYEKVTVYASIGIARNNLGNWNVRRTQPPKGIYGYRLYEMKDMAMADDADLCTITGRGIVWHNQDVDEVAIRRNDKLVVIDEYGQEMEKDEFLIAIGRVI